MSRYPVAGDTPPKTSRQHRGRQEGHAFPADAPRDRTKLTLCQSNRVRRALRLLRGQRYPTPKELAEALNLSASTVGGALSGRKRGGMKLARAVAKALGWELDVLLDAQLPVEPPPSDPAPASL